jgi:hypothetical protein
MHAYILVRRFSEERFRFEIRSYWKAVFYLTEKIDIESEI